MVIKTMEILFEYISIILCIQKIAKHKFKIDYWLIALLTLDWLLMMLISENIILPYGRLLIHMCLLMYTKRKVAGTWNKAIGIYGTSLIIIMSLQILLYYLFKIFLVSGVVVQYKEIISNMIICCFFFLWKEEYSKVIAQFVYKRKRIIIALMYAIVLFRILYLCNQNGYVDFEMTMQFLIETMGLSIAAVLWLNAETKNKHKEMELQMYEMYNKAFEETITTIRTRQHEFKNHINAIKCLKYTIDEPEKLLEAQEKYCNKVLQQTELNKLLTLESEPVVIGFLYSKITAAEEKKINVDYKIQSVNIKDWIAIYEFIEIIGILFDNAVEALEESEKKIIILKILMNEENSLLLEVANVGCVYCNNEIEKFCLYGYSTKGEKRGVGLARVKELVGKSNATLLIHNCIYDNENFLSFTITWSKKLLH